MKISRDGKLQEQISLLEYGTKPQLHALLIDKGFVLKKALAVGAEETTALRHDKEKKEQIGRELQPDATPPMASLFELYGAMGVALFFIASFSRYRRRRRRS
jgi:hypothetical protein